MKYLFFSFLRWFVVILASSIVFFALILGAGHILTPYFSRQTQTVVGFLSKLLNKPVQIGQFSVIWQGLTPILKGTDVIVWDDRQSHSLLQIKQLNLGLNLLSSLLTGHMRLKQISVSGVDLLIHPMNKGSFDFNGIRLFLEQAVSDHNVDQLRGTLLWLLTQPVLSFQSIHITYIPRSGPAWPAIRMDGVLKNQGSYHALSGRIRFLEPALKQEVSKLTFSMDLTGSVSQWSLENWQGRIYLNGENVLLDRWLSLWKQPYAIQNGLFHFKIWGDWQQGHFSRIQALFSGIREFSLQRDQQPLLSFMPFFAHLFWEPASHDAWAIDAIVQQFGMLPWKKIPGIQGLDAYLHMTPISGDLISTSSHLVLDFGKLFKFPIRLNHLRNHLSWQSVNEGFLIRVPQLLASNQDMSMKAQMGLLIPSNHKIEPRISILAHVKLNDPSHIADYLPQTLLGPDLIHWLSKAITKGSGIGSLLLQGPIGQFPFDKNEGTFLINTRIKRGELDYEPGWPRLEKMSGELIFSGRQMQIGVDSVQFFGMILKGVQTNIPLIKKHVQAVLHITTTMMNTTLEKAFSFLEATPLRKGIVGQLSGLLLNGPLQFRLQLSIPLETGKEKLKITGQGSIENAKVEIPSHDLQLSDLRGEFLLTQGGVQAQKLMANLWGKPIAIAIQSTPMTQLIIHYNGLQVYLKPEKDAWGFYIHDKAVNGNILIPKNKQQALKANFDSIQLDKVFLSKQANQWDLKRIPKIELNAKDIRYKDMNFGSVQFKLTPTLGGILIKGLKASNDTYHLIAHGVWHRQGAQSTELVGRLDSSNLSGFLQSLGLPAGITAQQIQVQFNLLSPNSPYQMTLSSLGGYFSFNASKGQILDIGSSAEAKLNLGRLLTFLSIQSLGRRLQFDFSDFKGKGFDFDTLYGRFTLNQGSASTRDVTIEGPVAKIVMAGRIGLSNKDYNLTVKVTPHFTSSLPVIVGLAGGPVAGVITWVANAILGSTIQRIATTSYHITGLWAKPEIVKTDT